ncbi:MAG: hypothetical protein IJX88_00835 [Clostridia bacterium]|nr:hypothetical protein [Clostridia bacterium]
MDAKITKQRIARLLSYDWLKIIGLCVAAILVWSLVFTMTGTRIRPSQQFTVFNHETNLTLDNGFTNDYQRAFKDGVFSYEVIETNINDLASNHEYAATLREARFATDEGDVYFLPAIDDKSTAYTDEETGETKYSRTYLQTFLNGNFRYATDIDKYFTDLETYLAKFYTDWTDENTLDTAKVEKEFRARAIKNKDKRFKKEAQIKQGVKNDIDRIEKYRDALEKIYGYLDNGTVTLVKAGLQNSKGEMLIEEKNFALNLCPNVDTMGGLKEQFAYYGTRNKVDENGNPQTDKDGKPVTEEYITAENMSVIFLNMSGVEDGFQYESLLYVVHLIDLYYTPAA